MRRNRQNKSAAVRPIHEHEAWFLKRRERTYKAKRAQKLARRINRV